MIQDFTLEQIKAIHDHIISKYGGQQGILYEATLEHLLMILESCPDPARKAATIIHCIAARSPFIDGNKRTAFEVANILLITYKRTIVVDNKDLVTFMLLVADNKKTIFEVEEWIHSHLQPLDFT